MENKNLYRELKAAKKAERASFARLCKTKSLMKREMKEAIKPIINKYQPLLDDLEKENDEKINTVWKLGGAYHDFGRFYSNEITKIFAILMSYVEGESFVPFASLEAGQGSVIMKKKVRETCDDNIDYETLIKLYKNGDLIMLDDGYSSVIEFNDTVGKPNFSFGRFFYLREFVNRLIQYRSAKNKEHP